MRTLRFFYNDKIFSGCLDDDDVISYHFNGTDHEIPLQRVKILSPVVPSKIVAVGLNYKDHVRELEMSVPREPILFIKPSTAIVGHRDVIRYPRGVSQVDYEAELAIVIKKHASHVPQEKAYEYIAGYTCFNDVTARDLQKQDIQWTRSKSFDTFAPIGPWIVDDIDPNDLVIRSFLNGVVKQESRTSEFIFGIPKLVSFISGVMTLLPGDVIATGTPPGIGPMDPGDEVVVEIEGIGRLVNRVARGED
ncbi:MAG: fumarylacetoacetate hydrolase family protein [Candidatus Omnitrophica bacterium]|nr:fumarylacetoacetate hydrolase family protein [Candidatus Omnitrophota bacterium]